MVVNHAFRIAHADGRVMANLADVRQAFADWEGELFLRIQLNLLTDISRRKCLDKFEEKFGLSSINFLPYDKVIKCFAIYN